MNQPADTPNAIISKQSRFSAIWILPIVAILLGAGMVYQQWATRGIEITLVFDNAEGLEAKKTKVKYRNVDIGTLQSVHFTDTGNSIEAKVEIDRNMQRFLRSDSQFWVVRPRIGTEGISGFGTLLSGAYISIEPGTSEYYSERFTGLDNPPISSPQSAGLKLTLASNGGKPLKAGNPVLYRGFQVGAVETVRFDIESRQVSYDIFIQAPYNALVTSNTFFWNSGGFTVSADTQGLNIAFSSIESIISGGVEFDVPEDLPLGNRIMQSQTFKLYESQASITNNREYEYLEYVILVDDSVGGLAPGAPVEYRGIHIGRVHQPYLGFHQSNLINPGETRIPVVIHVEPRRITRNSDYDTEWFKKQFVEWIRGGLAAQLETANYLTGSLKVSLNLQDTLPADIEYFGKYTVIPLSQSGFASIMSKTESLLSKLEKLPLAELANNTNQAIDDIRGTINTANNSILATQSVLESVELTLEEARQTLQGIQPDSPVYIKLERNLQEMERTLNMMQPFLQQIRKRPNALIFSEQAPVDIEPKGKGQ